jgi:hypothetical protein
MGTAPVARADMARVLPPRESLCVDHLPRVHRGHVLRSPPNLPSKAEHSLPPVGVNTRDLQTRSTKV